MEAVKEIAYQLRLRNIGGIIIGFTATILEIYTGDLPIYIILAYPIFEQLFKTIILNIGRYRKKEKPLSMD
jgi:hypothetical protein